MFRVLFIGDVVGRPGRSYLAAHLPGLRKELEVDLVVANGENAAAGAGITKPLAEELLAAGTDGLTLGDHVWDQRGFETVIGEMDRICRPANLDSSCPGRDHLILEAAGRRIAVFTLLGRQFMKPRDCPFRAADRLIERLNGQVDGMIAEIHAEATSEKIAFGRYLDGRVSAVIGTHTHVTTADASILPKGTGYITDVGMTGPHDSIIGREVDPVVAGFLDGMPRRFQVAAGDARLSAILLEIEPDGRCSSIQPIRK
ncbi:MAG: TIGR00282 family metallophosphoesterase [Opitutaceae bacterium]